MRKLLPVVVIGTVLCAGIYIAQRARFVLGDHASRRSAAVSRVVSLAPSVTETMFALGAQAKLVGVTRYCRYPPEAAEIARVGGYIDPSFEAIVTRGENWRLHKSLA
jgi:iron complex transport system substrate-binding protein